MSCLHGGVPSGGRVCGFEDLVDRILNKPGSVRLVAIDGPGGSGKTVFANRLSAAAGEHAHQVHTDDFSSWDEPIDWWPRLLAEVIEPLSTGSPGRFQRYDWDKRRLDEWHDVPLSRIVLIEGVGSSRRDWSDHIAFAVWVETPRRVRLERGLARDGRGMKDRWTRWMRCEDAHFDVDHPLSRVDLVVDGDPSVPHDPEAEFVIYPS